MVPKIQLETEIHSTPKANDDASINAREFLKRSWANMAELKAEDPIDLKNKEINKEVQLVIPKRNRIKRMTSKSIHSTILCDSI